MVKRLAAVILAVFIVFAPSAALAEEDDPLKLCPVWTPPVTIGGETYKWGWNCPEHN